MMTSIRNKSELNLNDNALSGKSSGFRRALFPILLLLTLLVALPASAAAGSISEKLDAPVVIGSSVFAGGTLTLAPATVGNVQTVTIDGQQVATVFRHAADRVPAAATARFVFRADEHGNLHLVGLRWNDPQTGRTEERHFRVAAVARASSRDDRSAEKQIHFAKLHR